MILVCSNGFSDLLQISISGFLTDTFCISLSVTRDTKSITIVSRLCSNSFNILFTALNHVFPGLLSFSKLVFFSFKNFETIIISHYLFNCKIWFFVFQFATQTFSKCLCLKAPSSTHTSINVRPSLQVSRRSPYDYIMDQCRNSALMVWHTNIFYVTSWSDF